MPNKLTDFDSIIVATQQAFDDYAQTKVSPKFTEGIICWESWKEKVLDFAGGWPNVDSPEEFEEACDNIFNAITDKVAFTLKVPTKELKRQIAKA